MNFYYGIVENRQDPLKLGRCQVRVVGLHTHDKTLLPTEELPWALPMQNVNSAAMNGIGSSPVGPVEGTSVIIIFADDDQQQPIILGTVGGISTEIKQPEAEDLTPILNSDIPPEESNPPAGETSPNAGKVKVELRTIPGPVTGKVLTLFDKQNPSITNVTGKLVPNMKVFGFNIPPETYIVSIDGPDKVTINNQVVNYEENIITFEPPPTNINAVVQSKINSNNSTTPPAAGPTATSNKNDTAAEVKKTPVNSAIPTVPPPKSSSNPAKASEGIKALIAACDKVGLTTKEQKCALLGIAGGESGWIPQKEAYNYSAGRLKQIFSFATDEDVKKYSDAKSKGVTREQFFSWCYGPTKRGKRFFGHTTDEMGGKYYGRGFIQLTGYSNYLRYNNLAKAAGLNIDIVNNPDSLDDDINVSALVAALYVKDRTSKKVKSTDHPGYFYAAKRGVGINSPDIAARKLKYYEYFYGQQAGGEVEKSAGETPPTPPADSNDTANTPSTVVPQHSSDAIASGSINTGFRDPNNKYPLKAYLNEPDTNRLARGVIEGTVIAKKDKNLKLGVPKAINSGTWDQPQSAYGAKYPYNKVLETESGHVQEFDDSPGYERIHTYHRSGTFTEVDSNGTQVNYIVGDNFIIMERNGCISVDGECNVTVEGNINIFARSTANIEVSGNANIDVGGGASMRVANSFDLVAGQEINLKSEANLNIEAESINIKANNQLNAISSAEMKITSNSTMDIKSSGQMNVDYAFGNFGNGADSASVDAIDLTPIPVGSPVDPVVPYLITPERQVEDNTVADTPEELDTPEGRAAAAKQTRETGQENAPPPESSETAPPPTGGTSSSPKSIDCSVIHSTQNFTNDFRLSPNFNLGMMIWGGITGEHKLVDQMLTHAISNKTQLYTKQDIVCNLSWVANNVMELILPVLPGGIGGYKKQWQINSGYRLKGIIKNETARSDHCKGHCVDIGIMLPDRFNKTYEIVQRIEPLINYDQVILEYRYPSSVWIHIGSRPDGTNRKMAFTMINDASHPYRGARGFHLITNIPPKST